MVEEALDRAVLVTNEHRDKLDALVVALLEHETLDGKEVIAIFGPGQELDPEAGIVPQQMVTIEATVRDNGRVDAEPATEGDGSASDGSLAAAGAAVEPQSSSNTA
jgi:cell division protease FtsH